MGDDDMNINICALAAVLATLMASAALAQSGPVATSCADEIAKLCADKPHDGSVRICLEQNYDKVSAACKSALDNTGGGRGKGLVKGKHKGKAD
jgi:hypothetical protein